MHDFLIHAERVGGDAAVLAVVARLDIMYTKAEYERVVTLVVRLDAVLGRAARDAETVLFPVVDGVRKGRYDTLENRLAAASLTHPSVGHCDFRSD